MSPEVADSAERDHSSQPRIYVASLSDYNAGRLHGAWINAAQEPEQIHAEVEQMLRRSTEPNSEEWAIHDYEGFGPMALSEYETFETVARIAEGIVEHGPIFAAWADHLDAAEWDHLLGRFDEQYRGEWSSLDEYAEDLLESLGYRLDELGPPELQPYIRFDLHAWANAAATDLIVIPDPASDTVHVFEGYE